MKYALWVVQVVLAVLFLFAGSMKLILSAEALTALYPLPELFMRFIGLFEVLGALGLLLPGVLRIRTSLTLLAASGLVVIMIGATVTTLAVGGGVAAGTPLALGLLATFVAYGRYQMVPLPERAGKLTLHPSKLG